MCLPGPSQLCRTALQLVDPRNVLLYEVLTSGVAPALVQHLGLGLEIYYVCVGPKLVQVPLEGIPSFSFINYTIQLGIVCKSADGEALIQLVFCPHQCSLISSVLCRLVYKNIK